MYDLATPEQIRELDKLSIEKYHIPGIILMENAGRELYDLIQDKCNGLSNKHAIIACGSGNNGGDGLVVARLLSHGGCECLVIMFGHPDKMSEDSKTNLMMFENSFPDRVTYIEKLSQDSMDEIVRSSDIIVDAIFGIGFHGTLSEKVVTFNKSCLNSKAIKFSADVPSGIESLTGKADQYSFKADYTVTFGLAKPGLFLSPALDFRGELYLGNIGIPPHLLKFQGFNNFLFGKDDAKKALINRDRNVHKGSFGKLLIIAGSIGMYGAPYLSSDSALKVGTGVVTLAVPENIEKILASKLTEVMTHPLVLANDGGIDPEQPIEISGFDCVLIGPGLRKAQSTQVFIKKIFSTCKKTLIVDADGVNALDEEYLINNFTGSRLILTPHIGELSNLCNETVQILQNNMNKYRELSSKYDAVIIGKGANPFIVFPDGNIYYTNVSNSGMAIAGMGDLLCGILAGLICEGKEKRNLSESIILAVFFHSFLGDIAKKEVGERSLTPSIMLDNIPIAFKELQKS